MALTLKFEDSLDKGPANLQTSLEDNSELLTLAELAAILKVPRSWVYAHTRSKSQARLPYIKVGKYLRFYETEVRQFLRELKRKR